MPRLIAIHGLKESGKSTTADRLVDAHGFVRVKMAEALKNMVRVLLRAAGYDDEFIERCVEGDLKSHPIEVLGGKTTRYVMQTLGTEWRDMILETLWVGIAARKIETLLASGHSVVVDDLRFTHEVATLRRFSPEFWVVTRGDAHLKEPADAHPSERPLPAEIFHRVIRNDWPEKKPLHDAVDIYVVHPRGAAA